jgi:beta-glucanase (GH16 family)
VAGPDCYVDNPSTISESGGYLNLSAVKVPTFTCVGNYTSQYETGMVTTRSLFTQTYGAFEVNAKLPVSTAPGLQETFWLYPQNLTYGKWPASGEIDFAEFYSQYPNLDVPYIHYNYSSSDPNVTAYNCTINPSQFNTYGVDWTPTSITVLDNGNVCLTDSWLNGPAPFNQPFFIALTQALGLSGSNAVNANTPLPATTQIDWVRAWTPAS